MSKSKQKMSQAEIEQFLTFARVGRIGLNLEDGPYIVPVGFVYNKGKVAFHSCTKGQKMEELRNHPKVCFEVDETISDASIYKSVILRGDVEILDDPDEMIPYLQLHIDKYRVPEDFESYMRKPDRNRDEELAEVRIVVITPTELSGLKFMRSH
jgi:nitroimidazol reductase NimA-like FMN-containing flavoprotein (pyridoxamine 5'-phosphate oxidase superfamily)